MRALLVWLALVVPAMPALAAASTAPQISLLTFAPGEIYWQRFGHNALVVRDGARAQVYNYGIFDFRQKNFFLNFARGRMVYRLDVAPLDWTLRQYAAEGRWAVEQALAFDTARSRELARFLAWNALPENAEYRYDYFLANCSTRVRDALDRAMAGGLRAQLESRAGGGTYRSEVLRLMAPMPALMIGMDLGLGPRVDLPLNQWQEGFIPMRLMQAVRDVRVDGRPLVQAERRLLADGAAEAPPQTAPSPLLPFALGGLGLAALLLASRLLRAVNAALVGGYALVCGLAGLVLAVGWLATAHWAMAANRNLLLLNPLWLLLLPATFGRAGARRPGLLTRAAVAAIAALGLVALPVALAGVQPNL
ncbi:MAG: DUF4105 domain-containing protein, partial [Gammaproteobacteria bacterium]